MTHEKSPSGTRRERRPFSLAARFPVLVICTSGAMAFAQMGCSYQGPPEAGGDPSQDLDSLQNEEATAEAESDLVSCPLASYLCGNDKLGGSDKQLFYCSAAGAMPKLVENCVGSCILMNGANDRCPMVDGWTSATGYRAPVLQAYKNIVTQVAAGNSPPSTIGVNSTWLTDISGGDGQRMRSALKELFTWYQNQPTKPPLPLTSIPTGLRTTMVGKLTATYNPTDANALVDRAAALFKGSPPPTTDEATLAYFEIKAQCKEYADRMIKAGGGAPKPYSQTPVAQKDARPGMYAFLYSGGSAKHAAIILDIQWKEGIPTQLRLGEANWASGWSNPPGQVPWKRTVSTTRTVPYTTYVVVNSL